MPGSRVFARDAEAQLAKTIVYCECPSSALGLRELLPSYVHTTKDAAVIGKMQKKLVYKNLYPLTGSEMYKKMINLQVN